MSILDKNQSYLGYIFLELKFSHFNGEIPANTFAFYFYEFFHVLMSEKFVLYQFLC